MEANDYCRTCVLEACDGYCTHKSLKTNGDGEGRDMEAHWDLMRHVELDCGYTLKLYDANRREDDRYMLAYEMFTPEGDVLFSGDDFGSSPLHAIDSDDTLRSLLVFLTLQPGDTDPEYFANYTPEQLAFAESRVAEKLSLLAMEAEDGFPARVFVDIG